MIEQEPPRIRVRLGYVSRGRKVPAWIHDVEHEVHSFSLDIVDDGTRDSTQRGMSFETVNSTMRDFIASTWIGDDFDLVFMPVKGNEPKPIMKQTDLAETILEWARLKHDEIQDMSVYNQSKLFSVFLTDVENLCKEYLKDGLDTNAEETP